MPRVLLVDNSARDAKRLGELLAKEGIELESCPSGVEADLLVSNTSEEFSAAIILWELPGSIPGSDVLLRCRKMRPEMPVVVTSELLDFSLASRAHGFGARKFLLKPFDSQEFLQCIRSLLTLGDPYSPLVQKLREEILGQSPAIIETLQQAARVIPHKDVRVLLLGETGTGKELFARGIHRLSPRSGKPWVPVNTGSIPNSLIESALFGHEKGAFTGAIGKHAGYFEEAAEGTLFLDEIDTLELSLQSKLLRVIQERKFRRVGGARDLDFEARLICATNSDLPTMVSQGAFRPDLFHRIAEVTIIVPPLRERPGDIDLLIDHFLENSRSASGEPHQFRFGPAALAILKSYPFPGNVRQLERLVTAAIARGGDNDLPLDEMRKLLADDAATIDDVAADKLVPALTLTDNGLSEIQQQLLRDLPSNWSDLPYRDAADLFNRAFDRVYLKRRIERSHHNIAKAARDAGIDTKTLRKRWKDSGLPPLSGSEDSDAD